MREIYAVLFANDYCEIGQDEELQAIILIYKRQGTSAELRDAHDRLLEVFKKKRKARLLVDTLKIGIIAPDDQRWVGQHVIPQLAGQSPNQFLHIAVLMPAYVFTQLAVDNIEQLSVSTGKCLNRHFNSRSAAAAWLREQ